MRALARVVCVRTVRVRCPDKQRRHRFVAAVLLVLVAAVPVPREREESRRHESHGPGTSRTACGMLRCPRASARHGPRPAFADTHLTGATRQERQSWRWLAPRPPGPHQSLVFYTSQCSAVALGRESVC